MRLHREVRLAADYSAVAPRPEAVIQRAAADLPAADSSEAAVAPEMNEHSGESVRPGRVRGVTAVLLLTLGLLLPWNTHVGFRITGTPGWVFALLVVATLLALTALVASRVGHRNVGEPTGAQKRRWLLIAPYLVLVGVFTLFSLVIAIRAGGNGTVPPGVGPGAWSGLAGALLAAPSPIAADDERQPYGRACRAIGWLSIALAAVAALLTLYLRTRFVIPGIGGEATLPNLTTAVAAVLYSVVAVAPVVVVASWIIKGSAASRLAVVMLGASAVVAGTLVWLLPVGRQLDSFHGIAQRTGTSFVGYEGYLAWVAVAAIVASATLAAARHSHALWRNAVRSSLTLVTIWCAGQAVLRITDVVLAGVLALPAPPYNSTALMAFDLITAVLAAWLRINSGARTSPVAAILFGVLFVLSVCRLVLGVALVPTVEPLNPGGINAVYGNHLAQQITSTFDVTVSVLSLVLLVMALRFAGQSHKTPAMPRPNPVLPSARPAPVAAVPTAMDATNPAERPADGALHADRVAEVLAQSTRRFAAGTTYGAPKPKSTEES